MNNCIITREMYNDIKYIKKCQKRIFALCVFEIAITCYQKYKKGKSNEK